MLVSRGMLSGALLLVAACSTPAAGVTCPAGQMVACSCNGSLTGQAACDSSGHEGPCQCTGNSGSSGGVSGSSSGVSGSSSGSVVGGDAATGADAAEEGGTVAGDAGPG